MKGCEVMKFEKVTTIEGLQSACSCTYGAVVKYGEYVLVADCDYRGGFVAAVYEFVEGEDEGFSDIERRLSLISESEERFADGGHALEWCMLDAVDAKESHRCQYCGSVVRYKDDDILCDDCHELFGVRLFSEL